MKRLISILLAAILIFCYTIPICALSTEELIEDTILVVEDNPTISNRIYNAIVDFVQEILSIIRQIINDIQPNCEHSGGTAKCCEKAICEKCGLEYGDFNPNNHSLIGSVNVSIPLYRCSGGYTGDLVCDGCGEMVFQGSEIPAFVEHDYYTTYSNYTTLMHYQECYVCGDGYYQTSAEPLEIEYTEFDDGCFYFRMNNCFPVKMIKQIEFHESGYSSSPIDTLENNSKEFYIYVSSTSNIEIITLKIIEFAGPDEIIRETLKSFDITTKTWIEE